MAGKTKIKPKEEINEFSNNFTWSHVTKKITELKPYEFNPRNITDKGLADLEKSIGKFGLAEPIVINTNGTIIGGHARYFALKKHGVKEVNCYEPDHELSEQEMKELNVRLNKNIAGDWDFDVLANNFEIDDLLTWGWDENELDINLWKPEIDEEKLDEVPEPQKEAVSRLGDIFLIDGKHRVMCGDSTKKEDVEKLMDGKKADLGLTDPPYNLGFEYNSYKDDKSREEYQSFCALFFNELKRFSVRQIITPGKQNLFIWSMIEEPIDFGIWYARNKMSGGKISNLALTEPIIFYGEINRNSRPTDFFDYTVKQQKGVGSHTCPKILTFWTDLVESYSIQSVLDLFLGSGSTLIASEQTNRICYGMELDPIYIDVILRRYKNLYTDCKIECLNREFDFKMLDKNE